MRRQTAEQEEAASRYLQLSLATASAAAAAATGGSGTNSKAQLPLGLWPSPATETDSQTAAPLMWSADSLSGAALENRKRRHSGTHTASAHSESTEDNERSSVRSYTDDNEDSDELAGALDSEQAEQMAVEQMAVETASPIGRLEALCARTTCDGDRDAANS